MPEYDSEIAYWGKCTNTFNEDKKHYVYGRFMGLQEKYDWFIGLDGKFILDIGGGPSSMLLKCWNIAEGRVYDPIRWPSWVKDRYLSANIGLETAPGEVVNEHGWDEVWIYNTLQHVVNPELIVQNAKKAAKVLRIFEWINIPPHEGHPHMLTQENLEKWIGQNGSVGYLDESGCKGECFYGVFFLI